MPVFVKRQVWQQRKTDHAIYFRPSFQPFRKLGKQDPKEIIRKFNCSGSKLRIVVYSVCLAGFLLHCNQRVEQYVNNAIAVDVRYKRNASLTVPCITFCPSDTRHRNPSVWLPFLRAKSINMSYDSTYDLLKTNNMNPDTLWNMSRIVSTHMFYIASDQGPIIGLSCPERKERCQSSPVDVVVQITVRGICETFCPVQDLPYRGTGSGIHVRLLGDIPDRSVKFIPPSYEVILHSPDFGKVLPYLVDLVAHRLGFSAHTEYTVRVRETINEDTWQNPCQSEGRYAACVKNCIETSIISRKNVSCRLPYLLEPKTEPLCKNPDEFKEVYGVTKEVVYSLSCPLCIRPCREIEYDTEHVIPFPFNHNITGVLLSLFLRFSSNKVEFIEEVVNYPISALFSDIGGALGLFLGICIFSVYEAVERFFVTRK